MAELVVVKGTHRGESVRIADGPITIGRAKTAQLALHEDTKVSHVHARLTPFEGDRYILEDLGSTNGTFVNDERIEQIPLRSGDLVRIGRSLLIFRVGGSSVHLSDVGLKGGGSSHDIRPIPPEPEKPRPSTARHGKAEEEEDLEASQEDDAPPPPEESSESVLEAMLLAGVAPDLPSGLERVAAALQSRCRADRAFVFLRHPLTGGLGRAALRARQGASDGLVDPDVLARAAGGDLVISGRVAAAPIPGAAGPLGAIYVDRFERDPDEVSRQLGSAGLIASLLISGERTRRLADSAIDIVALAQERVARQAVDLGATLAAADRLHGPIARQRGLTWAVQAPPAVHVLADPVLLARGLDLVFEHLLSVARGDVRVTASVSSDGRARVELTRPRIEPREVALRLTDPEGVVADLRRARETHGDAGLSVARVALLRAGVRLSVSVGPDERVVYALELEPAR